MKTEHVACLGAFARKATEVWLVVVGVELELRTQVTTKCRSPVGDRLTGLLTGHRTGCWSCYWKAVENLSVGSCGCSLEAEREFKG